MGSSLSVGTFFGIGKAYEDDYQTYIVKEWAANKYNLELDKWGDIVAEDLDEDDFFPAWEENMETSINKWNVEHPDYPISCDSGGVSGYYDCIFIFAIGFDNLSNSSCGLTKIDHEKEVPPDDVLEEFKVLCSNIGFDKEAVEDIGWHAIGWFG